MRRGRDSSHKDRALIDPSDIVSSLKEADVSGAIAESVDALIDSQVELAIPTVGNIVRLAKGGMSVRDKLFARKLLRFARTIDDVPHQNRVRLLEELIGGRDEATVGEILLDQLDSCQTSDKAAILGRLLVELSRGTITKQQYTVLSNAIAKLPDYVIDSIEEHPEQHKSSDNPRLWIYESPFRDQLVAVGLGRITDMGPLMAYRDIAVLFLLKDDKPLPALSDVPEDAP